MSTLEATFTIFAGNVGVLIDQPLVFRLTWLTPVNDLIIADDDMPVPSAITAT